MDANERLAHRVGDEQDDVLGALQLVSGDDLLEDRLFDQLVDLLVESLFLDLRRQHALGAIEREAYMGELAGLAELCRGAGLLPRSNRDG